MSFDPEHFNVAAENIAAQIYKADGEVLGCIGDLVASFENEDTDSAQQSLLTLDTRAKAAYMAAAAFQRAIAEMNHTFTV